MVEKIRKASWKTSLLGGVIIIGAVAGVITGKASFEEAISAIAIGAGFLVSKDHNK